MFLALAGLVSCISIKSVVISGVKRVNRFVFMVRVVISNLGFVTARLYEALPGVKFNDELVDTYNYEDMRIQHVGYDWDVPKHIFDDVGNEDEDREVEGHAGDNKRKNIAKKKKVRRSAHMKNEEVLEEPEITAEPEVDDVFEDDEVDIGMYEQTHKEVSSKMTAIESEIDSQKLPKALGIVGRVFKSFDGVGIQKAESGYWEIVGCTGNFTVTFAQTDVSGVAINRTGAACEFNDFTVAGVKGHRYGDAFIFSKNVTMSELTIIAEGDCANNKICLWDYRVFVPDL